MENEKQEEFIKAFMNEVSSAKELLISFAEQEEKVIRLLEECIDTKYGNIPRDERISILSIIEQLQHTHGSYMGALDSLNENLRDYLSVTMSVVYAPPEILSEWID